MSRKSFVSLVVAVLLGVGAVGFTAPQPSTVTHVADPICGVCIRGF